MENIHEYPSICRVFYIPDGAGFLPSTVSKFNPSFVRRLAMHHTDAFVPVPNSDGRSANKQTPEFRKLVGGFNPFEKYESKWESSPIFGVKIKNMFQPPPRKWCVEKNDNIQTSSSLPHRIHQRCSGSVTAVCPAGLAEHHLT